MKLHIFYSNDMQNSEMYRRGFVVPLSKKAEKAIKNNNVDNNTAVDFYELPNNEVFESLWEKKLFRSMNDQLGTAIDDYEEEVVERQKVSALKETIKLFENTSSLESLEKEVVSELKRLCDIALENRTSLFFIL